MTELTVTMVGDRPAVILSDALAERLNVTEGGKLRVIESPAGALLCVLDDESADQIGIATEVMERRREALRRLAE